jgi:Ran GTPase-activating protein (RanGAP) involved in mRNA processing and transport
MLVELLAQCPALAHIDLCGNDIGAAGAENFAGVLRQFTALAHLNLGRNLIREAFFAGVLGQCQTLAHLDLSGNALGMLPQFPALAHLLGFLPKCPALAHLNLSDNHLGDAGGNSYAGVMAQCPALAHLDLSGSMALL